MTDSSSSSPRIVCLGWGSLIWEPGELPVNGGWQPGGPPLPLEFCRVSETGELAIVLCPGAPDAATYWAALDVPDLSTARELLRQREKIAPEWAGLVGSVEARAADGDGGASLGPLHARIAEWARAQGAGGVVWTALGPKSPGGADATLTVEQALGYLRSLHGDVAGHAERYLRQVPADIRTPYRQAVEEQLGWTPLPPGEA